MPVEIRKMTGGDVWDPALVYTAVGETPVRISNPQTAHVRYAPSPNVATLPPTPPKLAPAIVGLGDHQITLADGEVLFFYGPAGTQVNIIT